MFRIIALLAFFLLASCLGSAMAYERPEELRPRDIQHQPDSRLHWGGGLAIRMTLGSQPDGHYVIRTDLVMVEPARDEYRWVPTRIETLVGPDGRPYDVVRQGYFQFIHWPPRYEAREVRAWVPLPKERFGFGFWSH